MLKPSLGGCCCDSNKLRVWLLEECVHYGKTRKGFSPLTSVFYEELFHEKLSFSVAMKIPENKGGSPILRVYVAGFHA